MRMKYLYNIFGSKYEYLDPAEMAEDPFRYSRKPLDLINEFSKPHYEPSLNVEAVNLDKSFRFRFSEILKIKIMIKITNLQNFDGIFLKILLPDGKFSNHSLDKEDYVVKSGNITTEFFVYLSLSAWNSFFLYLFRLWSD